MSETNKLITKDLIPGVYTALGQFIREDSQSVKLYKCALSIGWNPVYDNKEKTIEVYLIDYDSQQDFYGEELKITLKSYLRPEALFSTFNDLILAISCDVKAADEYLERFVKSK